MKQVYKTNVRMRQVNKVHLLFLVVLHDTVVRMPPLPHPLPATQLGLAALLRIWR